MAGTLNVPFTDTQQDGVQFALDLYNADNPGAPLALAAFGILRCQDLFDRYVRQRSEDQEKTASIRAKYLLLSDVDKTAVEALIDTLGGT